MFSKFFQLKAHKTNVKTELKAGIVTFVAMSYIIFVNADMLSKTGMPFNGVLIATALSAGITTILMAFIANAPIGLAPGMGINAFFTYSVVMGMKIPWDKALSIVFVSGVLFFLISLTRAKVLLVEAIPQGMKHAISVGIGCFITFIGLKNSGIVVDNPTTLVGLGNLKDPAVIITLVGFLLAMILHVKKVKGVILWSMLGAGITGIILQKLGLKSAIPFSLPTIPKSVLAVNFEGFSTVFGKALKNVGWVFTNPQAIFALVIFMFVDIFDTIGTMIPIKTKVKSNKKDLHDTKWDQRVLGVDAIGTTTGAVLGTSSVTAYIESLTGIEEGGRTGLASLVTGLLFLLMVFASPLTSFFSTSVTSIALIYVGALMFSNVKHIDWNDTPIAFTSFLIVIIMLMSFSIYWGIVAGFIFYPVVLGFEKGFSKVKGSSWFLFALAAIFIITRLI